MNMQIMLILGAIVTTVILVSMYMLMDKNSNTESIQSAKLNAISYKDALPYNAADLGLAKSQLEFSDEIRADQKKLLGLINDLRRDVSFNTSQMGRLTAIVNTSLSSSS